jgi:hypothetical protein
MIGDYDDSLEQPHDDMSICSVHGLAYWGERGCQACEEEAADRAVDDRLNAKYGLA